jgi:hypothetical protein
VWVPNSPHFLTKFDDLQASFSPSLGLRYIFLDNFLHLGSPPT